ncbi:MAG: hypothetical protein FWD45_01795 [Coriobacteriia bacterium]|nr:hypothetical protein [Coriobacteriia bacterium]
MKYNDIRVHQQKAKAEIVFLNVEESCTKVMTLQQLYRKHMEDSITEEQIRRIIAPAMEMIKGGLEAGSDE